MKGAKPTVVRARFFQRDMLTHQIDDVDPSQ